MGEIQVFRNVEFGQLRTITENGNTYYCGFDIATALEYAKPRNAIAAHCKGALKRGVPTNGGLQEMTFITEGDVYRLIAHSKMPAAERFEGWVFDEVLPTIRKSGMYATPDTIEHILNNPDAFIEMLQAYKAEKQKNSILEAKIEADAPKVEFAENLAVSDGSITVKEFAALLSQKGYRTGEIRMFEELRQDGFLLSSGGYYNKPAQRYVDMKMFEIKVTSYNTQYGRKINEQTLITTKGIEQLMGYYMRKHGMMPLLTTARQHKPLKVREAFATNV